MYTRSSYTNHRQTTNSNGFGFGLGAGLLLGYRPGFLYRPHYTSYGNQHQNEKYNQREDGRLECSVSKTVNYIKKSSDLQDVEAEEDSKICNFDQDICYGKLTISNVNLTLTDGKEEELLEVQIEKGCGKRSNFENQFGNFSDSRQCWTSDIFSQLVDFNNQGVTDFKANEVTVFDLDVKTSLGLEVKSNQDTPLMWQQEICICDLGDHCNSGSIQKLSFILLFWPFLIKVLAYFE